MSRLISLPFINQPFARLIPLLMLMSALSPSSFAEAPRWYDVEIALIGYQDGQKIDHENWPEVLITEQSTKQLDSEADTFTTAVNPWSWVNWWNSDAESSHDLYSVKGLQPSNIGPIPKIRTPFAEQGIAFENDLERFSKAKNLKLIWSRKWQQPIPEKDDTELAENAVKVSFRTPLNFQKTLNSSVPLLEAEVTGELYLYRSRYLHLVSKLNIQHWQSLNNTSTLDKSTTRLLNHPSNNENIIPSNSSTPLTAITEIPVRAAMVNQSRRMRSNELHYIDHPMLGILVRIIPIEE